MTAYWIAHVTVTDPTAYADYQALAPAAFAAHGATFLARGGVSEVMEGQDFSRHVVIAFPTLEAAKACYASDAYRRAKQSRIGAAITHVVIVDGLPDEP